MLEKISDGTTAQNFQRLQSPADIDFGGALPCWREYFSGGGCLDGLNRYAYCHDNPVKYTDPTGHIIDEDEQKCIDFLEDNGRDESEIEAARAHYDSIDSTTETTTNSDGTTTTIITTKYPDGTTTTSVINTGENKPYTRSKTDAQGNRLTHCYQSARRYLKNEDPVIIWDPVNGPTQYRYKNKTRLIPDNVPSTADIYDNMKRAVFMPPWIFFDYVRPDGDWDYKRNKQIQFHEFGNFNYGTTGHASGYPLDLLLLMGGIVQEIKNPVPGHPFQETAEDKMWIEYGYTFRDIPYWGW